MGGPKEPAQPYLRSDQMITDLSTEKLKAIQDFLKARIASDKSTYVTVKQELDKRENKIKKKEK